MDRQLLSSTQSLESPLFSASPAVRDHYKKMKKLDEKKGWSKFRNNSYLKYIGERMGIVSIRKLIDLNTDPISLSFTHGDPDRRLKLDWTSLFKRYSSFATFDMRRSLFSRSMLLSSGNWHFDSVENINAGENALTRNDLQYEKKLIPAYGCCYLALFFMFVFTVHSELFSFALFCRVSKHSKKCKIFGSNLNILRCTAAAEFGLV